MNQIWLVLCVACAILLFIYIAAQVTGWWIVHNSPKAVQGRRDARRFRKELKDIRRRSR